MEKDIAKANVEMEPLKTANRQLMNIIQVSNLLKFRCNVCLGCWEGP